MRKVALLVSALLLFSACGPSRVSGPIQEKRFEPAHTETYIAYWICFARDKYGNCTYNMPMYATRVIPDAWYIKIQDAQIPVSHDFYDEADVGELAWCQDRACHFGTPPTEKPPTGNLSSGGFVLLSKGLRPVRRSPSF